MFYHKVPKVPEVPRLYKSICINGIVFGDFVQISGTFGTSGTSSYSFTYTAMTSKIVYSVLEKDWAFSEDDLVSFSTRFASLFQKYFIDDKKQPKDLCKDIVLDNVLKHKYGYDMTSLMQIIHFVKVKQMCTGKFMQELLGLFPGWESLGEGHETGLDLFNENKGIFIELKNRYNTDNASAKAKNFEKLVRQAEQGYRAIYGVVNDKTKVGQKKIIQVKDNEIEYISADVLFKEITGLDNFSEILSSLIEKICCSL